MGSAPLKAVLLAWMAAVCLWAGTASAACPAGSEPTCAKAAVDTNGCCPVAAEAPAWCAPGRVLQGHCCAAGRAWSAKAGKCVDAAGGCLRGDAQLCLLAGEAARALGRPADLTQAEKLYAKACSAGLRRACVRQAEVQFPNAQGEAAQAALRGVFEKLCAQGDPLACSDLGVFYAYGIGIPADPAKAARLRKDACAAGEIDGCVDRARQQDDGNGLAEDPTAAVAAWLQACQNWHADACYYAGARVAQGRGAPADPRLGTQLLRRACEAGQGQACCQFSTALFNGRGTPANEVAAVPWMAEACARSDWEACSDLGWVTAHGRGVAADPAAARPILQQACDHGQAPPCVYLAELQRDGLGGPADPKQAAALFAKACQAGNQDGCAGQRALGEQRAGELAQQANALDKTGRYLEILPILDELLPLQEQRYGPAHPKVLDLLWQFAKVAESQSQWAKAYELFEQLLKRLRPLPEPRPVPLIDVVEAALSSALNLAKPEPALALVQEALALRATLKTPPGDDAWAVLRVRQAQALVGLGRPKEAAAALRQGLAALAPQSAVRTSLALHLAHALADTGDLAGARAVRLEAVAAARKLGDRKQLVEGLLELGNDYNQLDEGAAAERVLAEAQAIAEAKPRLEVEVRASVVLARASAAAARDRSDQALQLLAPLVELPEVPTETALRARRRYTEQLLKVGQVLQATRQADLLLRQLAALGMPRRATFDALLLSRSVRLAMADAPGAAKALQAAEALARSGEPRTGMLAEVLKLRADEAAELEDSLAALRYCEEAVELERLRLGPLHRDLLSIYSSAARLAAKAGRRVAARQWLDQLDRLLQANQPTPASYRAAYLTIRSLVLTTLGDSKEARVALDESVAHAEQVWGPDSAVVADVLLQLLILETEPRAQLAVAERILSIRKKIGAPSPRTDEVRSLALTLMLRLGRSAEACAQAREFHARKPVFGVLADCAVLAGDGEAALAAVRQETEEDFAKGSDALDITQFMRLRWLLARPSLRQRTVELLRRALEHDDARMARLIATGVALRTRRPDLMLRLSLWQALDLLRISPEVAEELLPVVAEAAIRRKGVLAEGAARWQAWSQKSAKDPSGQTARAMQLRRQLAALALGGAGNLPAEEGKKLSDQLQGELERIESQRGAVLTAPPMPTLTQVLAALPPDAALIDIEPTVAIDLAAAATQLVADVGPIVLILRRDRRPAWVDLGKAKLWQDDVKALRRNLALPSGPVDELAHQVYQRVFAPLQGQLAGVSELIVVPDMPLHLLPWAALQAPDGKRLTDLYAIRYLDHPRALLTSQAAAAPRSPPLLLAAPEYGPANAPGAPRHFQPLPGTVAEGKALQKLLPKAKLLTGSQATEGALLSAAGPSLLHIATHGFFLADLPAESILRGARGAEMLGDATGDQPRTAAQVPHPLLRSGLALAAANWPAGPAGDGLLTAMEAADLDLRGTQLVVLSACQTALGDVEPGLGVAGLTSSVQAAGAQSTVLSLWQVDDDATRALMLAFYRGLLEGLPRGQALRRAQAAIAAKPMWRHPFFWAAFILNGQDGVVRF